MDSSLIFIIIGSLCLLLLLGNALWMRFREKSKYFDKPNQFQTAAVNVEVETAPVEKTLSAVEQTAFDFSPALSDEAKSLDEIKISLPPDAADAPKKTQAKPIRIDYESELAKVKEQAAEPVYTFVQLYLLSENQLFPGLRLAQMLENLGFLFGEDGMYHRHLDLTDNSPTLFSVANIEQPGTFDVHHIDEFSTPGVVFFMQIPSPGSNVANFKMMVHYAEEMARVLGGVLLDEQQEIFTKQSEAAYLQKIAA